MPYMREGNCVYKKNPDDSMGENMGCSDSEEEAEAHMRALYAAENGNAVTESDSDEYDDDNDKSLGISFKQDDSGQWWFVGMYSNKFKDRDGEILTEASHKEYIDWLKETGVKPQITLMHQPQSPGFWSMVMKAYNYGLINTDVLNAVMKDFYKEYAIGQTEHVIYANGFTVVLAKVYESRIPQIEAMKSMDIEWGMSHGFVALNNSGNILEKYRSFEFSVLPKSRAANWWTDAQFREVSMPLTQQDKDILEKVQAGLANEVEAVTATKEAELVNDGVDFKEVTEEVAAEETPIVTEEANKEVSDFNTIVETMKVALNLEGLVEAFKVELAKRDESIVALENRIKTLEVDEDQKVASLYTPNWQKAFAASSAPEIDKSGEGDPKKEALKGWDVEPSKLFWADAFK